MVSCEGDGRLGGVKTYDGKRTPKADDAVSSKCDGIEVGSGVLIGQLSISNPIVTDSDSSLW